jgi:hypothetical protein
MRDREGDKRRRIGEREGERMESGRWREAGGWEREEGG